MASTNAAAEALAALLAETETGFGIGVLGAVGESIRDAGEPTRDAPLGCVTPRGGIAIHPDREAARLIAREEPSTDPRLWRQRAALVLPEAAAG